ncbi:MAG: hypothetical protein ACOCV1_07925 [Bacillota bacterium]
MDIQKELETKIKQSQNKQELYNFTFSKIDHYLNSFWNKKSLLYIDFAGSELDSRSSKKILYYLASTPKINNLTQVVIINPISIEIVKAVQEEMISSFQKNDNPFLYNPIPCIFYEKNLLNSYKVIWIGITELSVEKKLTELFYFDQHDFRKLDFENPNLIEGSFFRFDKFGNLESELPSISEIEIAEIISNNTIVNPDEQYLTAGNYYQTRYISLLEPLQDESIGKFIATHLINIFGENFSSFTKLLSVTLSSNVLGRSVLQKLSELKIENSIEHIYLSNYHSFSEERKFKNISKVDKVIIVIDIISTGKLITDIIGRLKNLKIKEQDICVLTIADNRKAQIDEEYEIPSIFEELKQIKIYSILKIEIKKFKIRLDDKIVRRINPITNSINSLSVEKSEIKQVLYPNPVDFLSKIENKYFKIGNIKHDKNTHPYFIDTFGLFSSENGHILLKELLQIIDLRERERIVKEKTEKEESIINAIKYSLINS